MASVLFRNGIKPPSPISHYSQQRCYRKTGYINKWIETHQIGLIVPHDRPELEYRCLLKDFRIDDKERGSFRPYLYSEVQFDTVQNNEQLFAVNVSALNNQPLSNSMHGNLFLSNAERTQTLIQHYGRKAMHYRHCGVVFKVTENGDEGYIIPDKLRCKPLYFHKRSIQSTGTQRLYEWAEVEFDVKPTHRQNDQAVCITRPHGQLITAEPRLLGSKRRYLGSLYKAHDEHAQIAAEHRQNRRRGYIVRVSDDNLYGWILVFESDSEPNAPTPLLHVHADDCHMSGNRKLRRFEVLEFVISVHSKTGLRSATHVTAPDLQLLRFHSANHFVSAKIASKKLEVSESRHRGIISRVPISPQQPYSIKPDELGCRAVMAYHGNVISLGSQYLRNGDRVEFSVMEALSTQHEQSQRAHRITAVAGYPLLLQEGELGEYYMSKIGAETKQNLLPEYGDDGESMYDVRGYIVNYSQADGYGFIEVVSDEANKRYRRILFSLKDAIVKDAECDYSKYHPIYCAKKKVLFTVMDIRNQNALPSRIRMNARKIMHNRKAVNIVTEGKNYLELGENKTMTSSAAAAGKRFRSNAFATPRTSEIVPTDILNNKD